MTLVEAGYCILFGRSEVRKGSILPYDSVYFVFHLLVAFFIIFLTTPFISTQFITCNKCPCTCKGPLSIFWKRFVRLFNPKLKILCCRGRMIGLRNHLLALKTYSDSISPPYAAQTNQGVMQCQTFLEGGQLFRFWRFFHTQHMQSRYSHTVQ